MNVFSSIASFFIGCGLFGGACAAPTPPAHSVSVATVATSSPRVEVVTNINGKTSTSTVDAPYGVQSSFVETSANGKTTARASTTPITKAQEEKMQRSFDEMQQQMNQMMARQQKLFQEMQRQFPF